MENYRTCSNNSNVLANDMTISEFMNQFIIITESSDSKAFQNIPIKLYEPSFLQ